MAVWSFVLVLDIFDAYLFAVVKNCRYFIKKTRKYWPKNIIY